MRSSQRVTDISCQLSTLIQSLHTISLPQEGWCWSLVHACLFPQINELAWSNVSPRGKHLKTCTLLLHSSNIMFHPQASINLASVFLFPPHKLWKPTCIITAAYHLLITSQFYATQKVTPFIWFNCDLWMNCMNDPFGQSVVDSWADARSTRMLNQSIWSQMDSWASDPQMVELMRDQQVGYKNPFSHNLTDNWADARLTRTLNQCQVWKSVMISS